MKGRKTEWMGTREDLITECMGLATAEVQRFAPPPNMLDDLLQDAAVVVIEAVDPWGPHRKGTLAGHIVYRTRRTVRERLRESRHPITIKDRRYRSNPSDATQRVLDARQVNVDEIPDPHNGACTRINRALDAAVLLGTLSGQERAVVDYRMQGNSWRKIQEKMGCSYTKAKKLYMLCIEAIRGCTEKKEIERMTDGQTNAGAAMQRNLKKKGPSPTPWRVVEGCVHDADGKYIFTVVSVGGLANAEMIVERVNAANEEEG